MLLGVDYYPEQWPDELLVQDLADIAALGCNVIRIGEFGWHMMEPEEGQYDFSYFDRVIAEAKTQGLRVIFGTPTATMPAWLAKKHPEVLSEDEYSHRRAFGGRRQYCFNSPIYRAYCEKIITALGTHYRDENAVIAWQIDNELGHEGSDLCWCPRCQDAFRAFLRRKYADISALNRIYGTRFWSQEYNDFDEIPIPMPTITTHNPSLRLDWERFRSESAVGFLSFTTDALRRVLKSNAVIFHDFSGGPLEKHYDYAAAADCIDLVAYNNYPVWGGQKAPLPPYETAFSLDFCRGMKRRNFWITEQIMGAQGHDVIGYLPRPQQAVMWSYQSVAHGCEALLYFRYRGAVTGAEQFCYGILDADNRKGRKYQEVKAFFEAIWPYAELLAQPMQARAAMIYDYDSAACFRIQQQSVLLDYRREFLRYYRALWRRGITVDVIAAREDFSGYDVVFTPLMIVRNPEFQARLKKFTADGGTAVLTFRTAVKDAYNNLTLGKVLPADYDDLAGVRVEESESLQEEDCVPLTGGGSAGIFREMLTPTTAETLVQYDDPFYRAYAAITCNRFGKGLAYYFGCAADEKTVDDVVVRILVERGLDGTPLPEGIERVRRTDFAGRQFDFYMNHTPERQEADGLSLEPYESKIVSVCEKEVSV